MITDEVWREIPFQKTYEVSSYGNLRRHVNKNHPERRQIRFFEAEITRNGYSRFNIRKQHYLVHRLVHLIFVAPLEEGMVVCHIDGNKQNNHFSNLMQATQKENISHKRLHGTWQSCENHPHAKLTNLQAITIKRLLSERQQDSSGRFLRGSIKNIANKLQVSSPLVYGLSRKRSGFKDVC